MVGASRFGNAATSLSCFRGAVTTSAIVLQPPCATPTREMGAGPRRAPLPEYASGVMAASTMEWGFTLLFRRFLRSS